MLVYYRINKGEKLGEKIDREIAAKNLNPGSLATLETEARLGLWADRIINNTDQYGNKYYVVREHENKNHV